MKIAYLLGSMNRGGSETLMLDVFRNAAKAEMEIIGVHRKGGDLYEDFMETGWPFFQVSPKNKYDLLYFIRLRKILKKNNINLVHAQHPVDAIFAIIATIFSPIKVTVTFHSFSKGKPGWYKYFLRILFRLVSMCFFVSKTQMDYYKNTYFHQLEKKGKVIYNSIDLNKFSSIAECDIRNELGISGDKILMGSVGNFNSARDQYTICQALKLLKKKNIQYYFIFAGAKQAHEPGLFDKCVEFCNMNDLNRNVFFLGPRKDIPSLLKQMDVFVYSSKRDTFGIAVIEAMISGTPVIVNDWGVMLEVTNNGEYAEVVNSKDPNELSKKIKEFISNRAVYDNRAEKLMPIIRKKYDMITYLQTLKGLYAQVHGCHRNNSR